MHNAKYIGSIDLEKLYSDWAEEVNRDPDYEDPRTGWNLKHFAAFRGDRLVLLFENTEGEEAPYYRELIFEVDDVGEEINLESKYRFTTDGRWIDGFGLCEDRLVTLEHDAEGKNFTGVYPAEEDEDFDWVVKDNELNRMLEKRSEKILPALDSGNVLHVVYTARGCKVDYTDRPIDLLRGESFPPTYEEIMDFEGYMFETSCDRPSDKADFRTIKSLVKSTYLPGNLILKIELKNRGDGLREIHVAALEDRQNYRVEISADTQVDDSMEEIGFGANLTEKETFKFLKQILRKGVDCGELKIFKEKFELGEELLRR